MYRAHPGKGKRGQPEGWPPYPRPGIDWTPGDGTQSKRRQAYGATPPPRTAVEISHIVGESLDMALFHLRQLEDWGVITHTTDEAGVMRWVRVEGNHWEIPDAPF